MRHDLLQKYMNNEAELELQALYALQELVTKLEHPAGIYNIFLHVFRVFIANFGYKWKKINVFTANFRYV